MNIILCGPPFTGKTTLGKHVAQKLGWPFKDTDRLLEEVYCEKNQAFLTCREIHRNEGDQSFSRYENLAIQTLKGSRNCVIALGGRSLDLAANVNILKKLGVILYIKTPLEILQERLMSSSLPSYLEKEADPLDAYKKIVQARSSTYEQHADDTLETATLTQDQIVLLICENWICV